MTSAIGCLQPRLHRQLEQAVCRRSASPGLYSRHRGQVATVLTPRLEARILEWTRQRKPADGSTHWSTRKLGAHLGVSHMMVARVWAKHGLKPHRLERYMASNDPEFETQGRRRHRAVSESAGSMRRCSASTRRRRFKRWIAKTRCCRCRRGAPSGMASSTTGTARCRCMPPSTPRPARCWARRPSGTPRRSSSRSSPTSWSTSPRAKRSTSSPTTSRRTRPSASRSSWQSIRNVHLHFTPTYSSWLNQVELWFAKIERDVIARGVFTSVPGSEAKAHALHPPLQQGAQDREVEILRSIAPHQYRISCYSPLVRGPRLLAATLACEPHARSALLRGSLRPGIADPSKASYGPQKK